jgi:hypothetical protein
MLINNQRFKFRENTHQPASCTHFHWGWRGRKNIETRGAPICPRRAGALLLPLPGAPRARPVGPPAWALVLPSVM